LGRRASRSRPCEGEDDCAGWESVRSADCSPVAETWAGQMFEASAGTSGHAGRLAAELAMPAS
jgi:hypothetical protein